MWRDKKERPHVVPARDDPYGQASGGLSRGVSGSDCEYDYKQHQCEEYHAQRNGNPKQDALDTAPGRENPSHVGSCQVAQSGSLTLQDDADDQSDRDYNQRDIQKVCHACAS